MLKVHEIFESIQGQGEFVGEPMLFVRLFGCSKNCNYCDTLQTSYDEWKVDNLAKKILKSKQKNICITGGEPTEQKELKSLLKKLANTNKHILVFTNGYDFSVLNVEASNISIRWDVKEFDSLSTLKYPKQLTKLYPCYFTLAFTIDSKEEYKKLEKATKENTNFFGYFSGIEVGETHESGIIKWLAKKVIKHKLKANNVFFGSKLHQVIGVR